MKILPKLIAVGFATALAFAHVCALTDPVPNPFADLAEGEEVFDGTVSMIDGEILTVTNSAEEEFSGRFDQVLKYRDGAGPAAANEFFVGDQVRVMVDAAGVLRAAQNAELLLCDQNFYGWARDPDELKFTLETIDSKQFEVQVGATTQYRDNDGQLLFGYSPRPDDVVRVHGVVNTNAKKVFTETFGAYISLLTEEALTPFLEEIAAAKVEAEKQMLAEPRFSDVGKDYEFYYAVQFVSQEDLVSGYQDGSFQPGQVINRAEFTKILMGAKFAEELIIEVIEESEIEKRSAEVEEEVKDCFPDVAADAWFSPFVCLAKEKGILGGYPDGTFQPGNKVNLAEAVAILVNTFGFGVDAAADGEAWFAPFLARATELQILPVDFTDPADALTRAQMTELVMRALKHTRGELLDYLADAEGEDGEN